MTAQGVSTQGRVAQGVSAGWCLLGVSAKGGSTPTPMDKILDKDSLPFRNFVYGQQ